MKRKQQTIQGPKHLEHVSATVLIGQIANPNIVIDKRSRRRPTQSGR